ncbi:MAG: hypothetical protein J7623_21660 [Chitinophaga sp.]|uniref:hypothetical protein n=1 Tax=Chitinophaga sp. TaxID=1869181 RepID=UPI001B2E2285|nr:hypothetical protein [Chitinophaga sp.]MBO9731260.1 hypothetical protein [Chitinophaga sp.]
MKYLFGLLLAGGLFHGYPTLSQVVNKNTIPIIKICKQVDVDTSLRKVAATGDLSHLPAYGKDKALTGYYKDSTLVKMILKGYDKDGKETFVYYYHRNALIFVYNEYFGPHYNDTGKRVPNAFESNFRGYYYFKNGKWLDEVSNGHNRFEDDQLDSGKILPAEAKLCRRLLP